MNREKLQQLRDHIATKVDDAHFEYGEFLHPDDTQRLLGHTDKIKDEAHKHPCGTIGCVAGHCCALFQNELPRNRFHLPKVLVSSAKIILDLTEGESDFLFYQNMSYANRKDAVRRMDWLLNNNVIVDYRFREESWGEYVCSSCDEHREYCWCNEEKEGDDE